MTNTKTLIDLDRDLVSEAQKALGGSPTIKEAVHEGLRRIVAANAASEFSEFLSSRTAEERQMIDDARQKTR